MRVAEDELPDMPGQDAFLDVLTNMVGIIILLVVVMGLRSSRAASIALAKQDPTLAAAATRAAAEDDLQNSCREAAATQDEVRHLVKQVVNVRRETLFREQERNELSTYVAAFEQELNERRAGLSADEQRDFDLRRQLAEAETTLDEVYPRTSCPIVATCRGGNSGESAHANRSPPRGEGTLPAIVGGSRCGHPPGRFDGGVPTASFRKCLATQRRKTPFGDRRSDRRLPAALPDPQTSSFKARRLLAHAQRGTGFETVQWELLPLVTPLGEPVDQAVLQTSELFQQLKGFAPTQRSSPSASIPTACVNFTSSSGRLRSRLSCRGAIDPGGKTDWLLPPRPGGVRPVR